MNPIRPQNRSKPTCRPTSLAMNRQVGFDYGDWIIGARPAKPHSDIASAIPQ
jgi:hypothetical protein